MSTRKESILVTGANGGLGTAIATQMASQSEFSQCHGLYLVKDMIAPALRAALAHHPFHPHDILSVDLKSLDTIRQAAEEINQRVSSGDIPPIRTLILNAAYQNFSGQTFGIDGLDPTFTINYLGHWLLVLLLLKSMNKDSGRIVVIGSQAYDPKNKVHKITFPNPYTEDVLIRDQASIQQIAQGAWKPFVENQSWTSGYCRYGAAKLCAMMMVHELQHRLDQDVTLNRICVMAVDPGYMSTGLQRSLPWLARFIIFRVLFPIAIWLMPNGPIRLPETAASHVLRAAAISTKQSHGQIDLPKGFYFEGTKLAATSSESRDTRKRGLVWRESVRLTRLKDGETVLANWR